jgi:3-dehydrotetronate 4-kinase
MTLKLGCIADDFTGATDLANNLVRAGMRVVQTIGVPAQPVGDVDCVVVALKSRTAPVAEAVEQSLQAARWLQAHGAPQIYFKVCSTFDSTPQGNIGPVTEALLQQLGADFAVVTPAFPENGRTVFKGHLFVGDLLLSDSPMRHHPLTPMTDANLVRVMQAQLRAGLAGLVDHRVVARGTAAVRERIAALRADGVTCGIADAVTDDDLRVLAAATQDLKLVVAGSGLAIGIPALHGLQPSAAAAQLPAATGARAIVSGSCSAATNAQVADFLARGGAAFAIDPLRLAAGQDLAAEALAWALPRLAQGAVLVYATATPDAVKAVQAELGADKAGALVEAALARVAQGLVQAGVGQLLVAGGETSGACVQALGVTQLRIGPQIDPGVPWCHAELPSKRGAQGLHLALKSGNFGAVDFFTSAFAKLA